MKKKHLCGTEVGDSNSKLLLFGGTYIALSNNTGGPPPFLMFRFLSKAFYICMLMKNELHSLIRVKNMNLKIHVELG